MKLQFDLARVVIAGLLVLGTVLRLGYAGALPDRRIEPDEFDYVSSAQALTEEGSFDKTVYFHVPPATPVAYAGWFLLAGPGYRSARVFQSLLFLLTGYVLLRLGKEVGGELVGLLALAFGAVYPYFIYFCGQALSETLGVTVVTGCLLFALRAVRSRAPSDVLWFGALLALASLTRASVLYFALALPLIYGIGWGLRSLQWIKATALSAGAFLVLYLPWVAVNYSFFGEVVRTPTIGSGVMLYQTALRLTMPDEAQRTEFFKREIRPKYYDPPGASHRERLAGDKYLQREGSAIIRAHLGGYPRIVWENFRRFWQLFPRHPEGQASRGAAVYRFLGLASFGVLLPFCLLGLVRGLKEFDRLSCMYGFIAYFTLVHALLYGKLRYRIPMDGLLLVFAALGVVTLLAWLAPAVRDRLAAVHGAATPARIVGGK